MTINKALHERDNIEILYLQRKKEEDSSVLIHQYKEYVKKKQRKTNYKRIGDRKNNKNFERNEFYGYFK